MFHKNNLKDRLLSIYTICVIAVVCTLDITAQGSPAQGNPAVGLFNAEIAYYFSYDEDSVEPDMSPAPVKVENIGKPEFADSKWGRGLHIGTHTGARTIYTLEKNVLSSPVSIAFWLQPKSWAKPGSVPERSTLFFLRIRASEYSQNPSTVLTVQRIGYKDAVKRPDQLFMGLISVPDSKNLYFAKDSIGWKNDEWHLVVINREVRRIGISIDGLDFSYKEIENVESFNRIFSPKPGSLSPGNTPAEFFNKELIESTVFDELIIFKRPLTIAEVKKLYEAGK